MEIQDIQEFLAMAIIIKAIAKIVNIKHLYAAISV